MAAWEPRSANAGEPFLYRTTTLPAFDRNLRGLAQKLEPTCVVAHVRGVTHAASELVGRANLHPFRFAGAKVAMAHNGHLREFRKMRYRLVDHIRPELGERIEGTTDSEWIYALLLSQLDDPYGTPDAPEIAAATTAALRVLREIRVREGIDTSSPVNLIVTTGEALVATRFSFDYGWYPADDSMLETGLPFVSLWYTTAHRSIFGEGNGCMPSDDPDRSLLIASEPLTIDARDWREVPEYTLITAQRRSAGIDIEMLDLDL